jgi:hypothetical protein
MASADYYLILWYETNSDMTIRVSRLHHVFLLVIHLLFLQKIWHL